MIDILSLSKLSKKYKELNKNSRELLIKKKKLISIIFIFPYILVEMQENLTISILSYLNTQKEFFFK